MSKNLYCKILDNQTGRVRIGVGCSNEYYAEIGMEKRNVSQSEKDGNWYLDEKCPHYTPEEIEQIERNRIANLHLTRGDVFRGLLLAKGITRAEIRGIIESMPEETSEERLAKEYALIDFDESLEFYRGVALIDTIGTQLGITSTQMDRFFDSKDWHELLTIDENSSITGKEADE